MGKLSEVKRVFFKNRLSSTVVIRKHAYADYPERGFSRQEVETLIRFGKGRVVENHSIDKIEGSFLFMVKDMRGQECKLVFLMEGDHTIVIIVCSAYRRQS